MAKGNVPCMAKTNVSFMANVMFHSWSKEMLLNHHPHLSAENEARIRGDCLQALCEGEGGGVYGVGYVTLSH